MSHKNAPHGVSAYDYHYYYYYTSTAFFSELLQVAAGPAKENLYK